MAVFMVLCEGYLGIKPNFALWRHFFSASVFLKTMKKGEMVPVPIGSCSIQVRQSQQDGYISMKGMSSNKGWHHKWFYLRNDAEAPLPAFTGRSFTVTPEHWGWGPLKALVWFW